MSEEHIPTGQHPEKLAELAEILQNPQNQAIEKSNALIHRRIDELIEALYGAFRELGLEAPRNPSGD